MAKKFDVCIVGGGNISNTRHIPAIKSTGRGDIVGVIGRTQNDLMRTMGGHKISQGTTFESFDQLCKTEWLKQAELAVVGTPPREHYPMVKALLMMGKHVLVEKPMVMSREEAQDLIDLSHKMGRHLFVMHNFQFANNFLKLKKLLENKELGEIRSFYQMQVTNDSRRLPSWYNDLPLGLFYDEAPHFFYLLETLGGKVDVLSCTAFPDPDPSKSTPVILNANLKAGPYPVSLSINFQSPVCGWYLIVFCTKYLAAYDLFRDILITVPNDQLHLAKNVLSNSVHLTFWHWFGTIINGFKMVRGNLLYGHDVVMNLVFDAIEYGKIPAEITAEKGLSNISLLNEVVEKTRAL